MLRLRLHEVFPGDLRPYASFDEEPEPRKSLLAGLIIDFYDQEELCLAGIARAEAGETVLDLYNNIVDVQLYPDGRVVIEDLSYVDEDDPEYEPPARAEFTLAEIKQVLLAYLAAKKEWQAQQTATQAAAAPVVSTPAPPSAPPTALKPTL